MLKKAIQQPLISPEPSEVGRRYDKLATWMSTAPWYRDERINEEVTSLIPEGAERGLELCCGAGRLLASLARNRPQIKFVGVDISRRMVELARRETHDLHNVAVIHGDWLEPVLHQARPQYDFVVIKNALHLLPTVAVRLRELKEVMSPNACLIIVETVSPNDRANRFVRKLFTCVDAQHLKRHFFTSHTLKKTLRVASWHSASKAERVRQYIDVHDWLEHKCQDEDTSRRAEQVLRMCEPAVRKRMEFAPYDLGVPKRMLRLQMIVPCWRSVQTDGFDDSREVQRQLELV